jgi:hypothetical protein
MALQMVREIWPEWHCDPAGRTTITRARYGTADDPLALADTRADLQYLFF